MSLSGFLAPRPPASAVVLQTAAFPSFLRPDNIPWHVHIFIYLIYYTICHTFYVCMYVFLYVLRVCVCVCVYKNTLCVFFIHSSLIGDFGCFHVLAVVGNAVTNMAVQMGPQDDLISLGCTPRSEMPGSRGSSVFPDCCFPWWLYSLQSHQQSTRVPFPPRPYRLCYCLSVWY